MDFYRRSAFHSLSLDAILNLDDIPAKARAHLQNVYLALAAGTLVAVAGYLVALPIDPMMSSFLGLLCVAGLVLFNNNSPRSGDFDSAEAIRAALFGGFTFLQGTSIAPFGVFYPEIVKSAFVGAFLVFASLTMSAFASPRRSYLFLGGILGSMLSISIWLTIFNNLIFRSQGIMTLQLYGGLLIFLGFVLFDTQLIIERARASKTDVFGDAVLLFIDAFGIFIRLFRIMTDNKRRRRD